VHCWLIYVDVHLQSQTFSERDFFCLDEKSAVATSDVLSRLSCEQETLTYYLLTD
jgi:hypothetical protein